MGEWHDLSAGAQLEMLRAHDLSARELTEHYLARIERLDHELGAFLTMTTQVALEEADRADALLAAGSPPPLCGLPIGLKDLHSTAGIRTTFGSQAMRDHVPDTDTWTVHLLRRAGAVVVGKTNTPEFGAACFTENSLVDHPAVTPYAVDRYSSGSSGGAATAVAAGLLPVAHGSDSAGSVRTPAATCHLVGMKPSRGLVSTAPAAAAFATGTEGAIGRTVADVALLLDVMAHASPADLYGWHPTTRLTDGRAPDRPLRIAYWTETGLPDAPPHRESTRAVDEAAARLREQDHHVEQIAIPAGFDDQTLQAVTAWFTYSVGAASLLVPPDAQQVLAPLTRHLIDRSGRLTALDVVVAETVIARYAGAFLAALDSFDAALTPTTNGPPVPIGHFLQEGVEGVLPRMLAWSCHTPWANFTGQPAISLPSHLDDDGLPHGIQLVGRPRGDAELLALAARLEPAELLHPPCWNQ